MVQPRKRLYRSHFYAHWVCDVGRTAVRLSAARVSAIHGYKYPQYCPCVSIAHTVVCAILKYPRYPVSAILPKCKYPKYPKYPCTSRAPRRRADASILFMLGCSSSAGRAANNCTTCFGGFKHKSEIISITRGDYTENSSDLSSGRRPTSKSDEF